MSSVIYQVNKNDDGTKEILEGIDEINYKYKNYIQFRDKLNCFIL